MVMIVIVMMAVVIIRFLEVIMEVILNLRRSLNKIIEVFLHYESGNDILVYIERNLTTVRYNQWQGETRTLPATGLIESS